MNAKIELHESDCSITNEYNSYNYYRRYPHYDVPFAINVRLF